MAQLTNDNIDWTTLRKEMVESQVRRRGIHDDRVLDAMLRIPREHFLPESIRHAAYEDKALPLTDQQTISQPYIVAYMTGELSLTQESKILEVGTGSGYQTAVLSALAGHVYSVERITAIHDQAVTNLSKLGIANITLMKADGSAGLPQFAPYDRIIVTAAAPSVPQALVDQLCDRGVLLIPIGGHEEQTLVRVVKLGDQTRETKLLACRFVKLIGINAWPES